MSGEIQKTPFGLEVSSERNAHASSDEDFEAIRAAGMGLAQACQELRAENAALKAEVERLKGKLRDAYQDQGYECTEEGEQ